MEHIDGSRHDCPGVPMLFSCAPTDISHGGLIRKRGEAG